MRNWLHPCRQFQKHNTQAVHVAFIRELMSQEILWVKVTLQTPTKKIKSVDLLVASFCVIVTVCC
jgi:hypothetical protein